MRHQKNMRAALIAITGFVALWTGHSIALSAETAQKNVTQTVSQTTSTPMPSPTVKHSEPLLFNANDIVNDEKLDLVIARGNVEISQSGRTLLADVVTYNRKTDTVTASGHVSVIQEATGETLFANYIELTNDMKDGFIRDFRMLLADRSRLAANTGLRTGSSRTELQRGVYSPCDLCATDPTQPPVWQIRAADVVRDLDAKTVTYHSATLELDGIPVFWTPYLQHPDPSVKRASGFLPPTVGVNSLLGFNVETPYYWAISPSSDLTLFPLVTANEGALLGGEYRARFSNGDIDARGSFTDSDPNPSLTAVPGANHKTQWRGDIFAKGNFSIDDNLRTGFDIQHVSDLLYLQEYKIAGIQNFLESKAFLEDFSGRDYGSVYAYEFQPTQVGVTVRSQPVVLPVASYVWSSVPNSWGAQFTTTANIIDLLRETGSSSHRVSLGTEMNLPFSTSDGQRFNFSASLRGDGYYVTSIPLNSTALSDHTVDRLFPQIGLEWRDPWVRHDPTSTWLAEPIVAAFAAPVGGNSTKIPNDDSVAVDFSDADLFVANRFQGYDRVDGGQRVDYGFHGNWRDNAQSNVDFLVGQSDRLQNNSPFNRRGFGDGLAHSLSDYVGHVAFVPDPYLSLTYRFRFDETDLRPRRQEFHTDFGPSSVRMGFTYTQLGFNQRDSETARQQVGVTLNVRASDYWFVTFGGTRDIQGDGHLVAGNLGVRYSDECTTFIASLNHDGITIGNFHPGTTLLFQLILKNLGEIVSPNLSMGGGTG